MNRFRKFIISAAILLLDMVALCPISAFAAQYPWLTFLMSDNMEVSVAADLLAINYSDGYLLLKSVTVDQKVAVADIKSMRFTTQSAGIDNVLVEDSQQGVYFNLSGIKVGSFTSVDAAREALPSGVYIVKQKVKTLKVIF